MQTSIQYNFKNIPVVPNSTSLIDMILSKTQRKTPTEVHAGYKITRIRRFYMRKVKFTNNSIEEKLDSVIKNFPKLDDIHPFYGDLINILYDKDHYKMALGYLNTAKNICEKIANDYVKLMKYGDSLYRCKQLKIAALGRMATTLKKLNSSLNYLEEVRKHLGRLPSIDPNTRTIILTGFPNVGKSSFMNKVTYAGSEVQPYPFTTQSLYAGHTYYKNVKWQVIDTPGILDRPLEERNTIEMQAITALAHLDACILFLIDISETCGYSIQEQLKLFSSIKPLFKNKPLIMVLNKTDIRPYNDIETADKALLEKLAQEHNTYLIQMSNESGDGVADVKKTACEILCEYRVSKKGNKQTSIINSDNVLDSVYIAQPKHIRDNRRRAANIPQSVVQQREIEEQERIENLENLTEEERKQMDDDRLRNDNIEDLERKIKHNRVKELMEQNGGEGIFFVPDRVHFQLENPEWKNDIMPEIMDGKNIFDYIDPDIMEKVERLEREEQEMRGQMDYGEDDNDEKSEEISEDLLEAHEEVMENKKTIRKKHKSVTGSTLPRKVRDLTQTERFMEKVRTDKQEGLKELKALSGQRRRDRKDKLKAVLQKNKKELEDELEEDEDMMDVEEVNSRAQKKKIEEQKKAVGERIKRKIQKKWSRVSRVDAADRQIPSKLPKHLNTGKRGIGKTDRR
jgi:nucleolar GTP-binding protein